MIWSWMRNRRRRRLLAEPFPAEWEELLLQRVRHFRYMPAPQRQHVRQIVQVMVAEKEWAGAGDFQVTRDMAVTIAGQAAVMASGFGEPYFFDHLHTLVIHPRTIRFEPDQSLRYPWLPIGWFSGVAWDRGPVVLSWPQVKLELTGRAPGHNVVLHEFAHHLDGLAGPTDGTPPLLNAESERRWYAVTDAEYLRLVGSARRDEATLLDHYGASNRAEFFAVSTECFFELPHDLHQRHGELYSILQEFYQQDPRQWLPRHAAEGSPTAAGDYVDVRTRRRRRGDHARLRAVRTMAAGDALFAMGIEHLRQGRPADAVRVFTELLQADSRDEESLTHRADALLQLGRFAEARADAEAAATIDPADADARRVLGESLLAERLPEQALAELNAALALDGANVDARRARARAWLALGRPQKAVADLSEALTVDPYDAALLRQRSQAYYALGRRTEAEADQERARLLEPDGDWPE